MSKNIIVRASLSVKEECVEEFIKTLSAVAEASRLEEGCLEYDFLRDVNNPNTFMFFELYRDSNAYQTHRQMPYMLQMRPKRDAMVEKYLGVRVFEAEEQ